MAQYIKREIVNFQEEGKTQVCYKLKSCGTFDINDLAEECARNTTFSEAEVKGVLGILTEKIASKLARGYSVHTNGIGTLTLKIGLHQDCEKEELDGDSPKRNAQSLHVTGVGFRPEKQFLRKIDSRCKLERGPVCRIRRSKYSSEERLTKALRFLETHTVMRLSDYSHLVGISRTTASLELRQWASDPTSGITSEGYYSSKVYLLRK